MIIVCMSDTHLRHTKALIDVPLGDILIHAGDAAIEGTELELMEFFDWFASLPHPHKIYVAGNHDCLFEKDPERARSLVPAGVTYLEDSGVLINGLSIWGSPWQPEFYNWAFNLPRGSRLKEKWDLIPSGTDILVTHGPPMGALDMNGEREFVGCADLRDAVDRVRPKLHVFGHIHSSYGKVTWGGTTFVNASVCDEAYRPFHRPIVVEVS